MGLQPLLSIFSPRIPEQNYFQKWKEAIGLLQKIGIYMIQGIWCINRLESYPQKKLPTDIIGHTENFINGVQFSRQV